MSYRAAEPLSEQQQYSDPSPDCTIVPRPYRCATVGYAQTFCRMRGSPRMKLKAMPCADAGFVRRTTAVISRSTFNKYCSGVWPCKQVVGAEVVKATGPETGAATGVGRVAVGRCILAATKPSKVRSISAWAMAVSRAHISSKLPDIESTADSAIAEALTASSRPSSRFLCSPSLLLLLADGSKVHTTVDNRVTCNRQARTMATNFMVVPHESNTANRQSTGAASSQDQS
jgi:hypothetical protein